MPLGVIVDLYLGYQVGTGPALSSWNVLPMSTHDATFDDLLHRQLYVGSGLPDEEFKTTPHGEIADIILSDSEPEYLSKYPVLLLVGDQDFSPTRGLGQALLGALASSTLRELLLQEYHVESMPAGIWSAIQATGKAKILQPQPQLGFHPPGIPAIANDDLSRIAQQYLPVTVENITLANGDVVNILWQVNAQRSGGFVIELSNEWGVEKLPCNYTHIDDAGVATVTLRMHKPAANATEWLSQKVLSKDPIAVGSTLTVDVPPGKTSFVAFSCQA